MSSELLINLLGLTGAVTVLALIIVLALKVEKIAQLQSATDHLKKSLDEMDEQAKLIVQRDIELNRTQEELDKKVAGLYTLQRLSRVISTTLEEGQIFQKIEPIHLEELGFSKACGALWSDKEKKFTVYLAIGYSEDDLKSIASSLESDKHTYLDLIRNANTISSLSRTHDNHFREKMNRLFKIYHFVFSPILPKEGSRGFLFVGTATADSVITEGDEELINILTSLIGQALENARLFENTWRAQQELEKKVEERTRALTLAMDELKTVSKRKTDFISAVSHELRTPLTSIKGFASILLDEKLGSLPPAVKERLAKINQRSDELVHMVNDLLDIARIESGKIIMAMEEQSLNTIAATVADLIAIQCKTKEIEMAVDVPENLPPVIADRSQIERVFINLLGNAVKFTPLRGKITVRARKKERGLQVDISDTGIGIPPSAVPKLFQEFYRVDNPVNEQVKGTGLGLSLVKHIIEAHKGTIWVESTPEKGSTFSFTLPLQQ